MKKEKSDQNAVAELTREWLYKENKWLWEENKKLKERVSELEDVSEDYDLLSKDFITLWEENEKLKSDLSECECSMHFENDEVWYRKRECKKLKEEIRFLEQCLDNKEKVNKKLREELEKLKSTYVYDAKQVRDIC